MEGMDRDHPIGPASPQGGPHSSQASGCVCFAPLALGGKKGKKKMFVYEYFEVRSHPLRSCPSLWRDLFNKRNFCPIGGSRW